MSTSPPPSRIPASTKPVSAAQPRVAQTLPLAPKAQALAGPWMTLAAAAAYLACNERTLRRRVASGDIVAHRFGRQLRFRQADLDQALTASATITADSLDTFITNSIKPAPRAP